MTTTMILAGPDTTCDVCDCTAPIFYHQGGRHLCARHVCLCYRFGWDPTVAGTGHYSRCPQYVRKAPACSRCGGLIHTAEECSMNEDAA